MAANNFARQNFLRGRPAQKRKTGKEDKRRSSRGSRHQSPTRGRPSRRGLGFGRLSHGALNTLLKIGRRVKIDRAGLKRCAKDLMVVVNLRTGNAFVEMIFDLRTSHWIQLLIQVTRD